MIVLCANVDVNVAEELVAKTVLREHALDSVLDELAGILLEDLASGLVMTATGVTRVRIDNLARELVASEADLVGIDDDDIVAAVYMRREVGLVLATDDLRNLRGEAAEDLIRSVDEQPLLINGGLVGRHGLVT